MKTDRRELRDWFIITAIILIGFLCLIIAGSMAVRFSPRWQLSANMDSRLDPNSDYLTNRPLGYIEPIEQSILTPPFWLGIFQTPGASVPPRTPLPTRTAVSTFTPAAQPPTATRQVPSTLVPTSTIVYIPASPTNTSKPGSGATPTNTVSVDADLQITKDDGTSSYTAGGVLTYVVVVSNIGSNDVTGATVKDNFAPQIFSASWTCSPGPGASCGTNGAGNINDQAVAIPAGQSVTYTITASVSTTASGSLVNTATVGLPGSYTDINLANNSATDIDLPAVDLAISKSDGVTLYRPGGAPLFYQITVTNNSTFQVDNAIVSDTFSAQIASASWYCTPSSGATCTANGTGNINDKVSIPAGLSVSYSITANTLVTASGSLSNTASVTTPAEYVETASANNSFTDTDAYAAMDLEIGPSDGNWLRLQPGQSMVAALSPAIKTSGSSGPDMVYFERISSGTVIDLDWVQVQLSADGINWFTVFYWGDGSADTNTNVSISDPTFALICPTEMDNCHIEATSLYQSTGVTIDIDSKVPPGSYSWIRISSPPGGDNDASEIDSIQPYYP